MVYAFLLLKRVKIKSNLRKETGKNFQFRKKSDDVTKEGEGVLYKLK